MPLPQISDKKLFQLCQSYGEQAKKWRYKFMGLLPEVYKRKLYEKKNFSSIFEFAKKLAGLSDEQVRRVLSLEKKFEATPLLRDLLVNGEVSPHKLARVASIATKENEEVLATQIKLLPQKALETLVRDEKRSVEEVGLQNTIFDVGSVRAHNSELVLSEEIQQKLLALQLKGIDLNRLLQEFLEKREQEIANAKKEAVITRSQSRYIPAKIRQIVFQEYGIKCSISHCEKPSQIIHHTQRFALSRTHDPHYLAPLCEEHHLIAHSIDRKFQEARGRS